MSLARKVSSEIIILDYQQLGVGVQQMCTSCKLQNLQMKSYPYNYEENRFLVDRYKHIS